VLTVDRGAGLALDDKAEVDSDDVRHGASPQRGEYNSGL
jgi:hypothetical protein